MSQDHPHSAQTPQSPRVKQSGLATKTLLRRLLEPKANSNDPAKCAFANFFESSPDPILLFDGSGEIVAKNQRATLFWDGSRQFLPSSVEDEVMEVCGNGTSHVHSGKSEIVEVKTGRGRRFFLPSIFRLLPSPEVERVGEKPYEIIACVMKDETAWMRSETIRNNLLASISHELNTPLTSARVALYLLAEQQIGKLNSNQAEMVDRAKEDLNREIATIRNVLALMRSDSIESDGTSEAAHHDLHAVLDEALIELREQTEALVLTINRFYSDRPPLVRMERETISLIIRQIFSCMLKYVEKGAVIDIVTIADDKDQLLKLVSSDPTLIKALPDNLLSLSMGSSSLRKMRAVDLGLRLAQEILIQHGGEISTKQDPEAATLTLRFPQPD